MLLACLWPCLCLGAVGCGSVGSRAYSSQSTPTLAPRRTTPFALQKVKERLLSCWPAAAATTATAIVTIIVQLLRRCCRSTINASRVRLITIWLIWSAFLPTTVLLSYYTTIRLYYYTIIYYYTMYTVYCSDHEIARDIQAS